MTNAEATPAAKPTRLDPIVTPDAQFFWDGADRGELLAQRCTGCSQFHHPPRPMCPDCFSVKQEEVKLSGRGTVYTWIRPHHPAPFGFSEPITVALIDLEEGIRLVSNLYGVAFEEIKAGLPVEVFFEPTKGGHKVPVFRPRAAK